MQKFLDDASDRDRLGWAAIAYSFVDPMADPMADPKIIFVLENDHSNQDEQDLVQESLRNGPLPVVNDKGAVDAAFISTKFLEKLNELVSKALDDRKSTRLNGHRHVDYIKLIADELKGCNKHIREQQQKIEKSTRRVLSADMFTDSDLDLMDQMPIHPASKGIDEKFR